MDYGQIIKKSISVVKKYKWLWVYGALLGGMGMNGSGGGGGSNSDTKETDIPNFDLDNLKNESASVLGTFTTSVESWLHSISAGTWILLVLGILFAVVIGVTVSFVLNAWARSSLIAGVQMALNDEVVSLGNTSPTGIKNIKPMIKLWFITLGITIALVLALLLFAGIIALSFSISKNAGIISVLIIGLPGIVGGIIGFILIGMTGIYSERLLVLKGQPPYPAWKAGFALARKNFWSTALMGIIASIVGAIFSFLAIIGSLIILAIPGIIMVIPSIMSKELPGIPVFMLLGILVMVFITAVSAISGMVNVFKFSNWNQVFNIVTGSGSDPSVGPFTEPNPNGSGK